MKWLEPWESLDDVEWSAEFRAGYCATWEEQLRREVGVRHALYGQDARLIARRFDTDDALFRLTNSRIAEVHLTWRKGKEPDPRWPATGIFASLEDWARDSMLPQHAEWQSLEGEA